MTSIPEKSALDFFPDSRDYGSLKKAAAGCKGCDIYLNATQTVFGEGSLAPQIMFVGEQPGDEEDRKGHPFVGPAGRLFDRALDDAGIARETTYVTNVVKHFKWKPRGKRRLHERPKAGEVRACLPWLEAELEIVKPRILIFLGATAAQAMLGGSFKVTQMRGIWLASDLAKHVLATVHPSSILRAPDPVSRDEQYSQFVADLRFATRKIAK
jgi:DNA polymerase